MNSIVSRVTGFCLDTLTLINRPSFFAGAILFFLLSRLVVILMKTILFERKLAIDTIPKTVSKLAAKHGLSGKIKIISDDKPLAFCLGFFRQSIYLSNSLVKIMSAGELEAIILHEKYHMLKKDNLFLVALGLFRQFFSPFPVLTGFFDNMDMAREIRADRFAINETGERVFIVSAFKKLIRFKDYYAYLPNYSSTFTESRHFETRIHALFDNKSISISIRLRDLLVSLFSLTAIIGIVFLPWQKAQADNRGHVPAVCLKNSDCSKHC